MENHHLTKKEKYLLKKQIKEQERPKKTRRNKIKKIVSISLPLILIAGGIIFAAINYSPNISSLERPKITVFYSPDCACCREYLLYLKRNGFEVFEEKEMAKRIDILEKYQIPQEMTSCHTSIIGDYFVEGHVPAEVIKKLLEGKPEIDGIVLPGMLQGSPGMPGFKIGKWTIYGFSEGAPSEFMIY